MTDCDLCGWPIEEWQKFQTNSSFSTDGRKITRYPPKVPLIHSNPADHKPTRNPDD